jgi:hypothetical protein
MHKKNYEAFADVLRVARATGDSDTVDLIVHDLSVYFAADNELFDRGRFERATR